MDSMEEIYRKYAKIVYAFLLTRTHSHDVAEELTQETFYQAVKNIHKFKGDSRVSTWLCGIAKNLSYEYVRKQQRDEALKEALAVSEDLTKTQAPVAAADSAESEVFKAWDNFQVMKQLHRLPDPMREVMYLRLTGNLTFGQIGEIMGRSENWARVTYYRGKEKLVKEADL